MNRPLIHTTKNGPESAELPPGVEHDGDIWTVHPHGRSPDDPQRIQAVVDLAAPGDTVRLAAGVFDFGLFENVRIDKDLALEGAWDDAAAAPATTIRHGAWPLLIGRRTPLAQPQRMTVAGHTVYHLTPEFTAQLFVPFAYPPYGEPDAPAYDIHTDWTPAHVDVRQIRFERPYGSAIWTSAQDGGTFERLHIAAAWPMQMDFAGGKPQGFGIYWFCPGWVPAFVAACKWFHDDRLYTGTDLVRGDRVVQDCVIEGDFAAVAWDAVDAAGNLLMAPYEPANPVPPGGNYDAYVLQDVPAGWDASLRPLPNQVRLYWVQQGYTAKVFPWLPEPRLRGLRGLYGGIYSLWTQDTLTARRNTLAGCDTGLMLLGNGARGRPFSAIIEDNEIVIARAEDFHFEQTALFAHDDYVFRNAFTGESVTPDPGMNIEFTGNRVVRRTGGLAWSVPAVDLGAFGSCLVEGNEIEIESGTGVFVWRSHQGAAVELNRIAGRGAYALAANTGAGANTLRANNLSQFEPAGIGIPLEPPVPPADILLLSDANTVSGGWDHEPDVTVLDYGKDNVITGMTRQVGRLLSEAERDRVSRRGVPPR